MRRILAVFIMLGLLLPLSSSACSVLHVSQSPFSQPSFKNDSGGTVSAIPVQENSNAGHIRSESRQSVLRHPPSGYSSIAPCGDSCGSIRLADFKKHRVFPYLHGLPVQCGITVVRLARSDQ